MSTVPGPRFFLLYLQVDPQQRVVINHYKIKGVQLIQIRKHQVQLGTYYLLQFQVIFLFLCCCLISFSLSYVYCCCNQLVCSVYNRQPYFISILQLSFILSLHLGALNKDHLYHKRLLNMRIISHLTSDDNFW